MDLPQEFIIGIKKLATDILELIPEPKDTDPIEDQFQYHYTWFHTYTTEIEIADRGETLTADQQDKLIPILKQFNKDIKEILNKGC